MADALQFSVDTTSLSAGIRALTAKIDPGKMASAMAIGFEILRLSSFEVPHDKGSLQIPGLWKSSTITSWSAIMSRMPPGYMNIRSITSKVAVKANI